ncbi:MAG: helix-turn-helix domain-containing protein, partial [Spirochaetales bacterium]|nr:helix-turn-helix domain-containing protein [Spirochaetales bacterium]
MPGNAPALEKGLRILEHVLAGNDPLTLSRIASDVGFKVSEIQRMVEYLANDGFLVKTASGAYTPGARAYGLADRKLDSAIIARAEGPMRRFAARCGASVHLGLLLQDKLHIVYEIEGTGDIRVGVRPGLYPALKTPSGRLLMAYLQRETGLFPEVKTELLREAYSFGELLCARGVYVVSVPIAVGSGRCAATLGAS